MDLLQFLWWELHVTNITLILQQGKYKGEIQRPHEQAEYPQIWLKALSNKKSLHET